MITSLLHGATLLIYLLAAVFYGANLTLRAPTHARRARFALLAGFVLHTFAIGSICVQVHRSPFSSALGTLSIAAWAVALIYAIGELGSRLPKVLGALIMPVCTVLLFAGILRSRAALRETPIIQSSLISLHVMLVLFSFALFALAACCAVCYIWQYRLLKRRDKHGWFRRLPPLETVDATAFHLVAYALPLLTLGLALGISRAISGDLAGNWLLDPHTITSFVAWLVYGTYLFLRTVGGWRGARPNYLLIAGSALTLLLFFMPSNAHRFV